MSGILGYKIGMTQLFDSFGKISTVTILKIGPCFISQINKKNIQTRPTIQLGYNQAFIKNTTKSNRGHFAHNNLIPLKILHEYPINFLKMAFIGKSYTIRLFSKNEYILLSGYSIGKGFQGTLKRHNFKRGPMTHGSKNHKKPGSIGQGTTPGRVFLGKKLAGRLGYKKTTFKNIKILEIDYNENLLFVNGTIPGKIGNFLTIFKR